MNPWFDYFLVGLTGGVFGGIATGLFIYAFLYPAPMSDKERMAIVAAIQRCNGEECDTLRRLLERTR